VPAQVFVPNPDACLPVCLPDERAFNRKSPESVTTNPDLKGSFSRTDGMDDQGMLSTAARFEFIVEFRTVLTGWLAGWLAGWLPLAPSRLEVETLPRHF